MASLAELKKSLNIVELATETERSSKVVLGKKRRPWVDDNEELNPLTREQHESDLVSNSDSNTKASYENLVSNTASPSQSREQVDSNTSSNTLANTATHESFLLASREQHVSSTYKNDLTTRLLSLSGHEKKLLRYIFKQCQASANLETNFLSSNDISNYLQINTTHLRNLIYRLSKKTLITVTFFQKNKSGLRRFLINKEAFEKLNYDENIMNTLATREQHASNMLATREQYESNNISNMLATPLQPVASSSSLINKTTTLTNEEKNELPDEWKEIDIESLEELVRFHQGHVKQLFKHGLDLKPVQESIYHYAFDLTENDKAKDIKTDPLAFFMGIMKRSGYYAAPENYESPQARGRRLFLEQEAKKAQKLLEAEKTTMNAYFEIWLNKLSGQEKMDLVGKDEMTGNGILMQSDKLKKHYKDVVWPEYYQKILNGVE